MKMTAKSGQLFALALMTFPFLGIASHAADYGEENQYVADWSGIYLGAQTGIVWNNVTDRTTSTKADQKYVPLGLFAGVNFQNDNFVYGLELDTNLIGFTGDDKFGSLGDRYSFLPGLSGRLRAGYAFGNTLAYVTGGYGFGFGEVKLNAGGKEAKIHHGWAFGGGFEHALNDRWSVRTEYQYRDFNAKNYNIGGTVRRLDYQNAHVLRAGIAYRF